MSAVVESAVGVQSLQAVDPSVLLDTSGPVRAAASFALTVLFGGFVLYRYGGRVDAAVAATTDEPLSAVLYGVVAFAIAVVLVGFAVTQLLGLVGAPVVVVTVGLAVAGVVVLTLGGAGFVVVGVWLAGVLGLRDPWIGLVAVGAVTAVAWVVLPPVVAAVVWVATAAVGLGGPTRIWMHRSTTQVER